MKITVLTENTSNSTLKSEHGLSLYIETEKAKILFDMGQSELFAENAEKLGIDLRNVDFAIISHGHYDHGGGLSKFLELNSKAKIFINKNAFNPHFNGQEKYIGLDIELFDNKRLCFTDDEYKICDGLTLYTCNNKRKSLDLGSFGLNTRENGVFVPDDFRHEQYLLIEENDKKVLLSGCSHKGILNIAEWFDVDIIIGGFHFSKLPLDEKLIEYSKILDNSGKRFFTCHCTGVEQYNFMKKYMRSLEYISTGDSIEI